MADDLQEFRRLILALNGPVTAQPNPAAVQTFTQLIDSAQTDADIQPILQALFNFVKCPYGEDPSVINEAFPMPSEAISLTTSLYRLVDLQEPFNSTLGLPALRNWFQLFNAIVNIAVGSERRLKLKYSTLGAVSVLVYYTPRFHPEFLSRLCDYIAGWRRRLVFDAEALDILTAAYRGEAEAIEKAVCHADGQIASHYILLREEFLRKGDAAGSKTPASDSLLPSYLYEVMAAWTAASDGQHFSPGEGGSDVAEWYRCVLGEQLISSIRDGRSEVETRYEPLFSKYRAALSGNASAAAARGQVIVLLKKEFKRRSELMEEELQLLSLIDSRHALLIRKLNAFARLQWHLETSYQ